MRSHLLAIAALLVSYSVTAFPQSATALKYHDILTRRPQAGAAFDRFCAEWVATGDEDALRKFLEGKSSAPAASPADHILLAIYFEKEGNDDGARTAYDKALQLAPAYGPVLLAQAKLAYRNMQFDEALLKLQKALLASPAEAASTLETAQLRVRLLVRVGKTPEALQAMRELQKAHPQDEDLAEDLISLLAEEGIYDEAEKASRILMDITRDASVRLERQVRLSEILFSASQKDAGLAELEKSLQLSGQGSWVESEVLSRIERIYRQEDDITGLVTKLTALSIAEPARVALVEARAQAMADAGTANDAVEVYRTLLARTPGRRDVQEGFLALLEKLKRNPEAAEQALALSRLYPDDRELKYRLASLQHAAKQDEEARATLNSLQGGPSATESDALRVARLFEAWEKQDWAKEAYTHLRTTYPSSISAREAQAAFLYRIGEKDEAKTIWKQCMAEGSLDDLLRVAQAVLAQQDPALAFESLQAREKEFAENPRYLSVLIRVALVKKEARMAVPWARRWLSVAHDSSELEAALKQTRIVLQDAGETESVRAELDAKASRTVPEACLLAFLQEKAGQTDAAIKTLDTAQGEQVMLARSALVTLYTERQDWAKAAAAQSTIVTMANGLTSANIQKLTELYKRALLYPDALKWVGEWKKLSPGARQPWMEEASLLIAMGKGEDGLKVLRAASRKFADDADVQTALATALTNSGKFGEAEQIYLALYDKTEDASAKLRFLAPLGLVAQQSGKFPKLIQRFEERQRQNRSSAQPWLALAELHRSIGNEEPRRRCLYEASRMRPQDVGLLTEIARVEEDCGLWKESIRTLEAAEKLDKTTRTREQIARIHLEYGDEDVGYRMLYDLAGGDKMDPRAAEQMVDAIVQRGAWDRALKFLQPLLVTHPKDYRLRYFKAVALEEVGNTTEALTDFVSLLEGQEELPGGPVGPPVKAPAAQSDYGPMLPPGVRDLRAFFTLSTDVYRHRMYLDQSARGGGNPYGYGSGLPRNVTMVRLPDSLTDLPNCALAHITVIGRDLPAALRQSLAERVRQRGIDKLEVLFQVQNSEGRWVVPDEVLTQNPENKELHAAWLVGGVWQEHSLDPVPHMRRMFPMFRENYPALAMQVAMQLWLLGADEKAEALLDAVSLIPVTAGQVGWDSWVDHSLAMLVTGDSDGWERQGQVLRDLPSSVKEAAAEVYFKRSVAGQQAATSSGAYAAAPAADAFIKAKQFDRAIQLLETNVSQHRKSPAERPASRMGSYGSLGPLVKSLPSDIFNILPDHLRDARWPESSTDGKSEVQPDKRFTAAIVRVHDWSLRLLLHLANNDLQAAEAELASQKGQGQPALDFYELEALIATAKHETTRFLEAQAQARQMRKDIEDQKLADWVSLSYCMYLKQSQVELTEKDETLIKEAADRLVKLPMTALDRQVIPNLLQSLDLNEALNALEKNTSVAGGNAMQNVINQQRFAPNPLAGYGAMGQVQAPRQSAKAVESLIAKGQTDTAVAAAARAYRQMTVSWLGNRSGVDRGELENLKRVLDKSRDMVPALDKLMQPREDSGCREWAEYGTYLELGPNRNVEKAVAAYDKAITAKPAAAGVRQRLISLLSETNPSLAQEHLQAIPERDMVSAIHELAGQLGSPFEDRELKFEHRLAIARVLTNWLNDRALQKKQLGTNMTQTFQYVLQALQMGESNGQLNFSSLFSVEQQRGNAATHVASFEARRKLKGVFEVLCRALVQFPETAELAASSMAMVRLSARESLTDPSELAREVLRKRNPRRAAIAPQLQLEESSLEAIKAYYFSNPRHLIVRDAALRQDRQALENDVFPLIATAYGEKETQEARLLSRLMLCPEAEFVNTAKEWIAWTAKPVRNPMPARYPNDLVPRPAGVVLMIWEDRKLQCSIDDLMIGTTQDASRVSIELFGRGGFLSWYIDILSARDDNGKSLLGLWTKLRDNSLGTDPERRRAIVANAAALAKSTASSGRSLRSHAVRQVPEGNSVRNSRKETLALSEYTRLMQSALQERNRIVLLPLLIEDGFAEDPNLGQLMRNVAMQNYDSITATQAVELMRQLDFLSEASRFRTRRFSDDYSSWLENVADKYSVSQPKADSLLNELKGVPRTFGSGLVMAMVKNFDKPDLKPWIIEQKAQFASLSPDGRGDISALLAKRLPGYPDPGKIGAELTEALAPLLEFERTLAKSRLDDLLKLTPSEAAQTVRSNRDSPESVYNLLKNNVADDAEKVAAVLRHLVNVLDKYDSMQLRRSGAGGRGDESEASGLLVRLGNSPRLSSLVLSLADERRYTRSRDWVDAYSMALTSELRSTADIVAFLEGSAFLAEAEEFRDYEMSEESGFVSLTQKLMKLNGGLIQDRPGRQALIQSLSSVPSKTFGQDWLLTLLKSDEDRSAVREFIASRHEQFSRLRPQSASAVFQTLLDALKAARDPEADKDDFDLDMLKPLWDAESLTVREATTSIMEAHQLSLLAPNETRLIALCLPVLDKLALRDQNEAVALLHKVYDLLAAADKKSPDWNQQVYLMRRNVDPNDPARDQKPWASDGRFEKSSAAEWLANACRIPEMVGAVMEKATEIEATMDLKWPVKAVENAFYNNRAKRTPDRLFKLYEGLGFTGKAEDFRIVSPVDGGNVALVLKHSIKIRENSPWMIPALLDVLKSNASGTFGSDFLFAYYQGNDPNLFEIFIRKHGAEMARLPAPWQDQFVNILEQGLRDPEKLRLELGDVYPLLSKAAIWRRDKSEQELKQLLATNDLEKGLTEQGIKSLADVWRNVVFPTSVPNGTLRRAPYSRLIAEWLRIQPETGAKLFEHFTSLLRDYDTRHHRGRQEMQVAPVFSLGPRSGPASAPELSTPSSRGEVSILGSWLALAAQEPIMIPKIMEIAESSGLEKDPRWLSLFHFASMPFGTVAEIPSMVSLLQEHGFLVDAPDFRLPRYPGPPSMGQAQVAETTLLHQFLNKFPTPSAFTSAEQSRKPISPEKRDQLIAQLRAAQPRTFGGDLVAALLSSPNDPASLEFAKTRSAELEKLPDPSKKTLARLFSSRFPDLDFSKPGSSPLASALASLNPSESSLIERFELGILEGRKIEDIEVPEKGFSFTAGQVLKRLVSTDPAKAHAFFLKLPREIGRYEVPGRASQVVYQDRSATGTSSFLESYLRDAADLPGIAFALRCYHEDQTGRLRRSAYNSSGDVTTTLTRAWRAEGGAVQPVQALEKLFTSLSELLGRTPSYLLASHLHQFLSSLGSGDRAALVQWAAQRKEGEATYALAKEMLAAHALLLLRPGTLFPYDPSAPVLAVSAEVWDHYRHILSDKALHNGVKLSVAQFVCWSADDHLPPDLALLAGKVLSDELEKSRPPPMDALGPVTTALRSLPDDEIWKELHKRLSQRTETVTGNTPSGVLTKISAYSPSLRLTLASYARDRATITDMMPEKLFVSSEMFSAAFFAELTASGQYEFAAEILASKTASFLIEADRSPTRSAFYSKRAFMAALPEESVKAVLDACKEPDLTLLAEFLLGSYPDANKSSNLTGPSKSFARRMDALAVRLASTPPVEIHLPSRDALCVLLVQESPATAHHLEKLLGDAITRSSKEGYGANSEPQKIVPKNLGNLYACHAWARSLNGDFETAVHHYKKLSANDSNRLRDYLLTLNTILQAGLADCPKEARERWLRQMCTWIQELLTPGPKPGILSFMDPGIISLLSWQAVANAMDTLPKEGKAASGSTKSLVPPHMREIPPIAPGQTWKIGAAMFGSELSKLPVATRLALAGKLLEAFGRLSGRSYYHCMSVLRPLQGDGWFTRDELVGNGATLAMGYPKFGYFAVELSKMAFDAKRPKQALALADLAMKQAEPSGTESHANATLHRAAVLIRIGKKSEAAQALRSFNTSGRPSDLKERDALLKIATSP